MWVRDVVTAPDTVHGGTPTPGLAGRVYLFGADGDCPVAGDGGLVIDLYDDGQKVPGQGPRLIEEFKFDPVNLKRLLKRDPIGWGYTLFLPWGTYRPDITQVHLRVCYLPHDGAPLYTEGATMSLGAGDLAGPAVAARSPKPLR
jgi:hypothetical protein